MMLSTEDSVASPPSLISNEELVKINPLYQHLIDNEPDAYYPWTTNLEEIALGEQEISIPCGFTSALYALSATTDDQLADYCSLLDS